MKSLQQHILEGLRLKIDDDPYQYHPTTWAELRQIIEERYKEQGPGTQQDPIDFNDVDVSGMNTFYDETTNKGIFDRTEFEYIDVSNWNVSNIINMKQMFQFCTNLKSVGDLSNWDVSGVKNISFMFKECRQLESIEDLSNWDVSGVKNMSFMFEDCETLKSIGDLSDWKVSKVEYMQFMFCICTNLEYIGDLNKWDVSGVKNINCMFFNSGITNRPDWYVR